MNTKRTAKAFAVSAFFVVKGYVEISAEDNVAELKKVVLPVFVLPIRPILIGIINFSFENIYLCLPALQVIFEFFACILELFN